MIAYAHASPVSVIFYCYMTQNKQSLTLIMQSRGTRCIICISKKVEHVDKEQLQKFYKKLYCKFK